MDQAAPAQADQASQDEAAQNPAAAPDSKDKKKHRANGGSGNGTGNETTSRAWATQSMEQRVTGHGRLKVWNSE